MKEQINELICEACLMLSYLNDNLMIRGGGGGRRRGNVKYSIPYHSGDGKYGAYVYCAIQYRCINRSMKIWTIFFIEKQGHLSTETYEMSLKILTEITTARELPLWLHRSGRSR